MVTDQPLDFYRLYSFRETYGVESLIPSEIGALVERMAGDAKLLEEYYTYVKCVFEDLTDFEWDF